MTKIYKFFEENIVVILTSLAIFISPIVVDYENLPKGFELPKVTFLVAVSGVIIFLGVIKYLEKVYIKKKFIFRKDFYFVITLTALFITATLVSTHFEVALYGNSFRNQGLITHLLLIWAGYVIYKSINSRNFYLLAVSFIFSGIVESALAYVQVVNLVKTDPMAILEGYWVNGTFGQANFFSGRLLLALIFICYYIGKSLNMRLRGLAKLVLFLCALFIAGALLLSLSIWGIIVAAAAFIIILLYELLPTKAFVYIFYTLGILGGMIGSYYIFTSTTYNLRVDIWKNIIQVMFADSNNLKNMLFGYGFDTLGHVFRDWSIFKGLFIDRAHNFFFDILFQSGIFSSAIVLAILLQPLIFLRRNINNRKFVFAFFALFFWLLRSFIHESGIVNLADFLVVLAMTFAMMKRTKDIKVEVELNLANPVGILPEPLDDEAETMM